MNKMLPTAYNILRKQIKEWIVWKIWLLKLQVQEGTKIKQ